MDWLAHARCDLRPIFFFVITTSFHCMQQLSECANMRLLLLRLLIYIYMHEYIDVLLRGKKPLCMNPICYTKDYA